MRTIILLMILTAAAFIFSACNSRNQTNANQQAAVNRDASNMSISNEVMNHDQMDHTMMPSSPNAETAPYDLQFLDTMTAHHQAAVDMARQAETKAQSTELKTLAKAIIADQEKEIAQMKKWRDVWFVGKPAAINMNMTGMSDSMKGMNMKRLESLSGKDFDLEFISEMIPHHEGAIAMAKEALQKSQREEIKTLANGIIEAQTDEINQMKSWQTEWTKN